MGPPKDLEAGSFLRSAESPGVAEDALSAAKAAELAAESRQRYFKWVALVVLLFQNSGTNLIMPLAQQTKWDSQSGVVCQEVAKGLACAVALLWGGGPANLAEALRPTPEALKTSVPAVLYLVQNNLQYVAATYLDSTLFAVLYQLKILTTALLSVLMLGKQIVGYQWLALMILVLGAVVVVLDHTQPQKDQKESGGLLIGVAAVLFSCFLSGLAGVYFEKLLKGSTVSLAARNLQLSGYSLVIGLFTFYQSGGNFGSFFDGYTVAVWVAVCNNAFGGLIVALVVKYADNIAKNFANTLSIVLTSFLYFLLLGGTFGFQTMVGVILVVTALFLYAGLCTRENLAALAKAWEHGPPPQKNTGSGSKTEHAGMAA